MFKIRSMIIILQIFLLIIYIIPSNAIFIFTDNQCDICSNMYTTPIDELQSHSDDFFVQKTKEDSLPDVLNIGGWRPDYVPPINYDPLLTGWYYDSLCNSLIYDALVGYNNETDEILPSLARTWVVSNDSKHWTFYLRNDVFFHDGTKFNASSVKFMYERLVNKNNPAFTRNFSIEFTDLPLQSVVIDNEYQVTINFNISYAPFINYECPALKIASQNSFNESGVINAPIGTGPYILDKKTSTDDFQNFTRFLGYFQGVPPFKQIYYFSQQNFKSEIAAQSLEFFPIATNEFADNAYYDVKLIKGSGFTLYGFFNHHRSELANRLVRLAINHAINRPLYIEMYNKNESTAPLNLNNPLRNLIPPGVPFANKDIPGFPFDIKLANNLLDEAGYPRGSDGYRFSIDLVGFSIHNLPLIKDFLDSIGIAANIYIEDSMDKFWASEFDIHILGFTLTNDPHSYFNPFLNSAGLFNNELFQNSTMDTLIKYGSQTPIKQEREYYYYHLQDLVQISAPHLYLIHGEGTYAVAPSVNNYVSVTKLGTITFQYLNNNDSNSKKIPWFLGNNEKVIPLENSPYTLKEVPLNLSYYENIKVDDYPVYFPFADVVVETYMQESISVNLRMGHLLSDFLPYQNESGKFFQIEINNPEVECYLRCYYDTIEVNNISFDRLGLHQWNNNTQTWIELETLSSNTTLRYIQTIVKGNVIIKLFEKVLEKTYHLTPLFILVIIGVANFTLIVIIMNIQYSRRIKDDFHL